jgi:hypothetical protein
MKHLGVCHRAALLGGGGGVRVADAPRGDYVLPHARRAHAPVQAHPQSQLRHAVPHRSRPLCLADLPGMVIPYISHK